MIKTNRREFIRSTGLGVAGLSALQLGATWSPARAAEKPSDAIPPHQELAVPGVHAYPMEHSVAAGETLELCVSSTVPYSLTICRLGLAVDDPLADTVMGDFGEQTATPQPIHPGSYVHVAKVVRGNLRGLSLECWVRPWALTRLQGIISQEDKDASDGFALGIGKDGYVGFYLGDGVSPDEALVHRSPAGAVTRNKWNHLLAT